MTLKLTFHNVGEILYKVGKEFLNLYTDGILVDKMKIPIFSYMGMFPNMYVPIKSKQILFFSN